MEVFLSVGCGMEFVLLVYDYFSCPECVFFSVTLFGSLYVSAIETGPMMCFADIYSLFLLFYSCSRWGGPTGWLSRIGWMEICIFFALCCVFVGGMNNGEKKKKKKKKERSRTKGAWRTGA